MAVALRDLTCLSAATTRLPQYVSASFNNYQQSCGIAIRIAVMVEIRVDIDALHVPGRCAGGALGRL